jgi:hypothetical protein
MTKVLTFTNSRAHGEGEEESMVEIPDHWRNKLIFGWMCHWLATIL